MLLVVMALPIMVACNNGDDSEELSYTEAEVVEILTGQWEVYGELNAYANETGESFSDNYKGIIEFKANQSLNFKVTEGQMMSYSDRHGSTYEYYPEESIIRKKYSLMKKEGKYYITFGSTYEPYTFEILSLTKTSFKMRMDDDIYDDDTDRNALGHIYMTLNSN